MLKLDQNLPATNILLQMVNATIKKVSPQESELDDDETQNTTHSGSDGGIPLPPGADAKILKKPGLGKLRLGP